MGRDVASEGKQNGNRNMPTNELHSLVKCHGWTPRSASPATTRYDRALQVRAAEAARDGELYGDALGDVQVLRQRGWLVVREGQRFRVGNAVCTLEQLRAKADRERRLR